jgi:hypothetical protein
VEREWAESVTTETAFENQRSVLSGGVLAFQAQSTDSQATHVEESVDKVYVTSLKANEASPGPCV